MKSIQEWLVKKNRCISSYATAPLNTFGKWAERWYGWKQDDLSYIYPQEQLNSKLSFAEMKLLCDGWRINNIDNETSILRHNRNKGQKAFEEDYEGWYRQESSDNSRNSLLPTTKVECNKEEEPSSLPPSPHERCKLLWFQSKAAIELLDNIKHHPSVKARLLVAATGVGKTFIAGAIIRRIIDWKLYDNNRSLYPFIYVTRASIVEQTSRVLVNQFGIDEDTCLVINIEQLRSKFGELFVKEKTIIKDGEEETIYMWREAILPQYIILDECHQVKNADSVQTKIMTSLCHLKAEVAPQIILTSATPFTRVIEAKCFLLNSRIPLYDNKSASEAAFEAFATNIAYPKEPTDYSPAAMDRLMEFLENHRLVTSVKGVKPQFHARNTVQMIDFANEAESARYESAWERYLKAKAKLDEAPSAGGAFLQLAMFTKFRQEAEDIRVPYMADFADDVVKHNQVAVIAVNFKTTIIHLVKRLMDDYGYKRSDISIIWGGATPKKLGKKAAAAKKISENEELLAVMREAGLKLDDLDLEDKYTEFDKQTEEELKNLDDRYDLGPQSRDKRQDEIDKFQRGSSSICIFTFKSGGVGLSLHHTDELTKQKVRRKDSGYAVEEDIPSIPTKQRVSIVTPTYSAIELVQGLGRAPRITSLSDTPQTVVFYRGTIEERVAYITSAKLACLKQVVKQRESWQDVIIGAHAKDDKELRKQLPMAETKDIDMTDIDTDNEEEEE